MPLLTPSANGRWMLSIGRRGEGGELVLVLLWPQAGGLNQVYPGTGEAQTALDGCWVFPGLLEGSPHVECGRMQGLLAVLPLRLTRGQAMQRMEGSEQGLDSLSQQFWPQR